MKILEAFGILFNTLKALGLDVNYPVINLDKQDFDLLEHNQEKEALHR